MFTTMSFGRKRYLTAWFVAPERADFIAYAVPLAMSTNLKKDVLNFQKREMVKGGYTPRFSAKLGYRKNTPAGGAPMWFNLPQIQF